MRISNEVMTMPKTRLTVGLFVCSGVLGWRLERGAPISRDTHALIAVCAVLCAGLAFATGWVLLP